MSSADTAPKDIKDERGEGETGPSSSSPPLPPDSVAPPEDGEQERRQSRASGISSSSPIPKHYRAASGTSSFGGYGGFSTPGRDSVFDSTFLRAEGSEVRGGTKKRSSFQSA
jgi:hypothetical protein